MDHLLAGIANIPSLAIYGFVFVWLAAESAGAPVPNELVLLFTGSLAANGHVAAPLLTVVAVAGSVLGASFAYAIGRRGGRATVLRFGRYLRLDAAQLDMIEAWFARTGVVAILIARITPFVRTVASYPAGMLRMPRRAFLLATIAGSALWCIVLVTLGDLLGKHYTIALNLIQQYTLPAILVLAVLVAGYIWLHSRIRRTSVRPISETERQTISEREVR